MSIYNYNNSYLYNKHIIMLYLLAIFEEVN